MINNQYAGAKVRILYEMCKFCGRKKRNSCIYQKNTLPLQRIVVGLCLGVESKEERVKRRDGRREIYIRRDKR